MGGLDHILPGEDNCKEPDAAEVDFVQLQLQLPKLDGHDDLVVPVVVLRDDRMAVLELVDVAQFVETILRKHRYLIKVIPSKTPGVEH